MSVYNVYINKQSTSPVDTRQTKGDTMATVKLINRITVVIVAIVAWGIIGQGGVSLNDVINFALTFAR